MIAFQLVFVFSLLSQVLSQGSRIRSTTQSQTPAYIKYCDDQDKELFEDAATTADGNQRVHNRCMCGFTKTPHNVHVSYSSIRFSNSNRSTFSATCVDGFAGPFPCSNVDLLAYMNVQDVNGDDYERDGTMNDIWGWEDLRTGREYALVGTFSGTSFIDITDPRTPINLGKLRTRFDEPSYWRDIKTYHNHAFIVAETPTHGMQVFDLTRLRGLHNSANLPIVFEAGIVYEGFGNSHNLAINEETGYAYAVGTNTCDGGLHMIDILYPQSPMFAGCFDQDGYTHDVQCVTYIGSDTKYLNREICFASNTDSVTIIDVTDKKNPVLLSRTIYTDSDLTYTHQGWLTPDHSYFVFGDETDEMQFEIPTTTHVLNVKNLQSPFMAGSHVAFTYATDHNQYIRGGLIYQANYRAGLRILNMTDISSAALDELGFFDVVPEDDDVMFNGAWSTYPYFKSGTVIVTGIEQGLFILRPTGIIEATI